MLIVLKILPQRFCFQIKKTMSSMEADPSSDETAGGMPNHEEAW